MHRLIHHQQEKSLKLLRISQSLAPLLQSLRPKYTVYWSQLLAPSSLHLGHLVQENSMLPRTELLTQPYLLLHNAGFTVKVGKTNPPVVDRINSVNSMLQSSSGERKLFIDPKCKRLRECLIKHSYKEGTRQPDKDSGYDHLLDSLGYMVYNNFAIRKQLNEMEVGAHRRRTTGRMV